MFVRLIFGQIGERALKSLVKDHAQQTQQQVNVFASQCSDREYESTVYNHDYNDIKHLLGAKKKNELMTAIPLLMCVVHLIYFQG